MSDTGRLREEPPFFFGSRLAAFGLANFGARRTDSRGRPSDLPTAALPSYRAAMRPIRTSWTALLVGVVSAPALANEPPVILPSTEVIPPAETKPDDFVYVAATRPDRMGRVMAPVYVNGVGPFAFIVDTGASSSAITPRVAVRLGITPDPARSKLLRGITGSEVVPTVAIDSLSAGAIRLEARELPVVEPRVFANADGIFGADAFARGCLHVDFRRARVAIRDAACPRVGSTWETVPAKLRFGGLVVVNARVGRTKVVAIVDTGAERSLGNKALLAALELEERAKNPKTQAEIYAATSQAVVGNLLRTPMMRIGGLEIGSFGVVYGDFDVFRLWGVPDEPALVLGMDVLGTAQSLMVDFQRAELKLLPQGRQDTSPLQLNVPPPRIPRRP
jgi:hypothetical protein